MLLAKYHPTLSASHLGQAACTVHTHQVDFSPLIAHEGPIQLLQIAVGTKQATCFSSCDSFSTCSGKEILLWKLTQRCFDDRRAEMTITPCLSSFSLLFYT